ncbi:hypothetical protein GCM10023159_00410 [Brevibacterium yomogidense]
MSSNTTASQHNRSEVDELVSLLKRLAEDGGVPADTPGANGLPAWREDYPYDTKLSRKEYEKT